MEDSNEAIKPNIDVYMVGTSSNADSGLKKHKLYGGYKEKAFKKQKSNSQGKRKALQTIKKKKKIKAQIKCFNCDKKGHFACECTEPKKVKTYKALSSAINNLKVLHFF